MGITRLANLTGLDHIGLPVYTCIRPNARSIATSQGKGVDADSARASALMESIETWHAERVDGPLVWGSVGEMRRRGAIVDVDRLVRFAGRRVHHDVGRPWIEAFDLLQQHSVWVPFEVVSLDFVREGSVEEGALVRSSNGLASGNHLLEAICHGLCEVIERDAYALWIHRGTERRLDLSTVGDDGCRHVLGLLDRAGIQAAAWDITSDIDVPAYAAVIAEPPGAGRWRSAGVYSGWGCHLSPDVALMRALTEAVQTRLTFIAGSRDDTLRTEYLRTHLDEANREYWEELCREPVARRFDARTSRATETFQGDLDVLLAALRSAGLTSAAVVDLTRPEIGIPVAKTIVPGLEHYKSHTARGKRAS